MKVILLKISHKSREKAFALVLMLNMLFQKTAEKPMIEGVVHHGTFKEEIAGVALIEMLQWEFRPSERQG